MGWTTATPSSTASPGSRWTPNGRPWLDPALHKAAEALLALFKLRGEAPAADIVDFFAGAEADIRAITGPIRDLEQRVVEATRLGAIAYIPSGRGGDVEAGPADAELQLELFEE